MGQTADDRIQTASGSSVFETGMQCTSSDFHSDLQLGVKDNYQQKSCALNLVRDSVVAYDPKGHVTYLNQAAEKMYGWTFAEVVGRAARKTLFSANNGAFDVAWSAVWDKGEWCGEITHLTRDGTERLVESRWSIVRDEQLSRITSILTVATEVSNLNTAVAGFAHEIRNPLAGIKGVADAFLQRPLLEQEREWMEAIRHEVVKIDARIREVLDLSRPRAFNLKPCLLSELINGVVQLATHRVKSINERYGRSITVEFIDATTEPLVMALDAARIEDAVLNLVLNGIESIEGNGLVTVCLRTRRGSCNGGGAALIEVTDNGSGIPQEIRRRVFEPRFTTKREGTGLGLAAVRRTAAACHGRITFKSRVGRGTKFVLALPLRSQTNLTEIRS